MSVTAFDVISPVDEAVVRTVGFADRTEVDGNMNGDPRMTRSGR